MRRRVERYLDAPPMTLVAWGAGERVRLGTLLDRFAIDTHTQRSTLKRRPPRQGGTFPTVYGVWYNKFWSAGKVSAGWYVESLDYSGVTGLMDKSQTYGYCIY